jgi:hypothetical protein
MLACPSGQATATRPVRGSVLFPANNRVIDALLPAIASVYTHRTASPRSQPLAAGDRRREHSPSSPLVRPVASPDKPRNLGPETPRPCPARGQTRRRISGQTRRHGRCQHIPGNAVPCVFLLHRKVLGERRLSCCYLVVRCDTVRHRYRPMSCEGQKGCNVPRPSPGAPQLSLPRLPQSDPSARRP